MILVMVKKATGSPTIPVRYVQGKVGKGCGHMGSGTSQIVSDRSLADRLVDDKPSTLNECAHTTRVSDTDPINSRKTKPVFSADYSIKEVIKHNLLFPCVSAKIVVKQCVVL
jgi:hypothetical protein